VVGVWHSITAEVAELIGTVKMPELQDGIACQVSDTTGGVRIH